MTEGPSGRQILVTGATGFVGERLTAALRDEHDVTVLVRDADRLRDHEGVRVIEGDMADPDAVADAVAGVDAAYYLVHSMESGGAADFAERDRALAETFIDAAGTAALERIVYLGGIDPRDGDSAHLASRREVESILRSGVPDLVTLRASMIVGAQSGSFRTLAQVVRTLPALPLPAGRETCSQPIAVGDVIGALGAALDVAPGTYDIGGPDSMSIEALCEQVAELLGHHRPTISLPVDSPRLEAFATSRLADADRELLEPLMEGLRHDLRVGDNALSDVFGVTPTPFATAARAALDELDGEDDQTLGSTSSTRNRMPSS